MFSREPPLDRHRGSDPLSDGVRWMHSAMPEYLDASVSPLTTWSLQGFVHDPAFLASQDELRTLLFTTAQTPAPTRRGSLAPLATEDDDGFGTAETESSLTQTKQILANGRNLDYLKNYVGQVAPWVSGLSRINFHITLQNSYRQYKGI